MVRQRLIDSERLTVVVPEYERVCNFSFPQLGKAKPYTYEGFVPSEKLPVQRIA